MLIFGSIAVAFFLIMAAGFLFGHHHDFHDHSFDHGDAASVSVFSLKVISTFGCGFGAAGSIATAMGANALKASGIGAISGGILAAIMYAAVRIITKQQSCSLIETESLIDQAGTV